MMLKAGEAAKLIYISRPAVKKDLLIPYIYACVFWEIKVVYWPIQFFYGSFS